MSMRRLAVLSAVHASQYRAGNNGTNSAANGAETQPSSGQEAGGGGGGSNSNSNMSSSSAAGGGRAGRFESDLHGNVNILLGGAMLGGVMMVVVLVCYCCHRSMRKSTRGQQQQQQQDYSQHQQHEHQQHEHQHHQQQHYWRTDPDVHGGLDVFTMDSHAMCYERTSGGILLGGGGGLTLRPDDGPTSLPLPPRPLSPGPPPAYESLVFHPSGTIVGPLSPSDKKPATALGDAILDHHHHHRHHHEHHHDYHRHHHQHRDYGIDDPGAVMPIALVMDPLTMDGPRMMQAQEEVEEVEAAINEAEAAARESTLLNKGQREGRDDEGLPTYEAALRLEAQGYV